jgi:hypothetical protein
MIKRLPFPWFDIFTSNLSIYDLEFRNHYLKDVDTNKVIFTCCNKIDKIINYHHIIPINELGSHSISNLIPLCSSCHRKAESGLLKLPKEGKYYGRGLMKKKKLQLRWFVDKDYENNLSPTKRFIVMHLAINWSIKHFLRNNDNKDRLIMAIRSWEEEGFIKNTQITTRINKI